MKVAIDVTDREEAKRVQAALTDVTTRAFMNVMGALLPLPSKARLRVLDFVSDALSEDGGGDAPAPETPA